MSGPAFRIANDYSAIFPIKYSNYTILYSDNSGGRMVFDYTGNLRSNMGEIMNRRHLFAITIVFIAFIFVVGLFQGHAQGEYRRHWAYAYLNESVARGWLSPQLAATPDDYISRANFLKTLELAFDITPDNDLLKGMMKTPAVASYDFSDTPGHWISSGGWLKTAIDFGLVMPEDYPDNMFNPEGDITRRECIVMVIRALGRVFPSVYHFGGPLLFKDWSLVPNWFKGYAYQMAGHNLLIGYPDKTLRQNRSASVAEAAAFIARAEDEMTRGIAQDINIFVADSYGEGVVRANKYKPAQVIDGRIYMPVRALYDAGYRIYSADEDISYRWNGKRQILEFEYGVQLQYQPGNRYFGFYNIQLPHWNDDKALTGDVRLLQGEVMVPVYGSSGHTGAAFIASSVYNSGEKSLIIQISFPQRPVGRMAKRNKIRKKGKK
jgi:hypothetical protein